MIRLFITVLFIVSIKLLVIGQKNEQYIDSQLISIDKLLDKGEFVKGLIYLDNDTIDATLFSFKGKRKSNHYLFCIVKTECDSIRIFKSNQICGYRISGINYISHHSGESGFFIKQVKTGKIELFEKTSLPDDNRFLYYLKLPNIHDYYIINPLEKNIIVHNLPDSNQPNSSRATVTYFQSTGTYDKFKVFISTYLGDCEKVTNMVKTDFYTINDIPSIVDSYNNCFE
jgi:hypothetical protein